MKKQKMYRQGDVFIEAVKSIPTGARKELPRDAGRIVLAYGEVTGHVHAIKAPDALLLEVMGQIYLTAATAVSLEHEEHAPISLPAGHYRVVRQREYSPAGLRSVAD